MPSHLVSLVIDAHDPTVLTRFWAGILHREIGADGTSLEPNHGTEFRICFEPTDAPKVEANQMHFDLTSTSLEDQQATVDRALELGGRHHDVGQLPDEGHIVLADPEGNEFCVIEPGNNFLADTGVIGALSSDGSEAVGRFWSAALDWPLVWDQDEETAIQSPDGGSKITWGGPPVREKTRRNRWHFDLAPPAGGDQAAEVERLIGLGAVRVAGGDSDAVAMVDPDDNEFCVLSPR